jgi:hypothetical protein
MSQSALKKGVSMVRCQQKNVTMLHFPLHSKFEMGYGTNVENLMINMYN